MWDLTTVYKTVRPHFPFVDIMWESICRPLHDPRKVYFHVWMTLKNLQCAFRRPPEADSPLGNFPGNIDVDINHDILTGGARA